MPTFAGRYVAVALLSLWGPATASLSAQPAAGLHGTVTDQTGGVLVGASVVIEDRAGNRRTTVTDADGRYRFDDLAPGQYTISVMAEGFRTVVDAVDTARTRSRRHDVVLRVVVAAAELSVTPDGARAVSSLVLEGASLDALPSDPMLFIRRLVELAGMTGRPEDVALYIDGFRDVLHMPPKAAIQMIRISPDAFAAEYAEPGRGRIEITTRPGADKVSGHLSFDFTDDVLNARDAFAPDDPPMQYRSLTGYITAPIVRRRWGLLAYAGHWGQDENSTVNALSLDPTTVQPQRIVQSVAAPTRVANLSLRSNALIAPGQTLGIWFDRTSETRRNQGLDSGFDLPERAFTLRRRTTTWRSSFTSAVRGVFNELRAQATQSTSLPESAATGAAILVLDAFNGGAHQSQAFTENRTTRTRIWNYVTLSKGAHTMRAGVDVETIRMRHVSRSNFGGTYVFGAGFERDAAGRLVVDAAGRPMGISPIENYRRTLLGHAGYGPSLFSIAFGEPLTALDQTETTWFAQDDWRLRSNVTLSAGLRHEWQTNLSDRRNFAPRATLAWTVDQKRRNVFRIGAGLFYRRLPADITFDTERLDGQHQQTVLIQQPDFPFTFVDPRDITVKLQSVYRKSPELLAPTRVITAVSFERRLPKGLHASLTYTGERGSYLLRLRNLSALTTDAETARVFLFESAGRSRRDELLFAFRGGTSKHSFYVNYTLGNARNDTDEPYALPADSETVAGEFSAAAADQRHVFVAGGTLLLPRGVFVTPHLTIASGTPFNITTGLDNNNDTLFLDRPAFADPLDPHAVETPYGLFNPYPEPGDAIVPRNFGRQPAQWLVSLNVAKTLARGVSLGLDLSNALNRTNLTGVTGVLTSPVFGIANRAGGARRVQLSVRYGF